MKPYLIKTSTDDHIYDITQMYEDLDKINLNQTGESIKKIYNTGVDFKISECQLLNDSQFNFEKIPKISYNSKIINIIKNKDEKCFIYCYIRKFLNPITKHSERVTLKDKHICTQLEYEFDCNFDNVKIKDIPKIENLLKTNIYIYTCNKNLMDKIPVYKSDKDYDQYMDLLLFNQHYEY